MGEVDDFLMYKCQNRAERFIVHSQLVSVHCHVVAVNICSLTRSTGYNSFCNANSYHRERTTTGKKISAFEEVLT